MKVGAQGDFRSPRANEVNQSKSWVMLASRKRLSMDVLESEVIK
jgi:hypothetical protein